MSAPTTDVRVEIDHGELTGRSRDGVAFFGGIPYAADPAGDLRFALPQPPTWTGPRDARGFGPSAPQFRMGNPPFDLASIGAPAEPLGPDYLNLNVWTPTEALDAPAGASLRPVMVFVHGGSFTGGSGSAPAYHGTAFARSGVVLITINYRLGVIGFGHLPGAPDNRGLHDQIAALGWIHDHAATFGGDPDNVTIFGESAGAICVSALAACAPTGLFRRVISESGGSHGLSTEQATVAVDAVADRLGIEATVDGFNTVADDAVATTLTQCIMAGLDLAVGGKTDPTSGLSPFGPVIDSELLTDLPAAMIANGNGPDIELIVGSNRDELNLYTVLLGLGVPDRAALRASVARVHPDPDSVISTYEDAGRGTSPNELFAAIGTDVVFAVPSLRLAQAQLERGNPCWRYEFGWRSPGKDGAIGACHGIELPFVFDGIGRIDYGDLGVPDTAETRELAADLQRRWVAFAALGDPGWTPVSAEQSDAFGIGGVFSTRHPEWAVWDGVS